MDPHHAGLVALGLVLFLFLLAFLRSGWSKGKLGESKVNTAIRRLLDQDTYRLIENVTLPTSDGTTQIDHIVVSPYGIFVIETKNMTGWIFGDQYQARWTQQIYRYKGTFQNPLRQNHKHVKVVQNLLELAPHEIFNVVVFVGGCTFKTQMPPEVVQGVSALSSFIKSKHEPVFKEHELPALIDSLANHRLKPGVRTDSSHVRNLKMESSARRSAVDLCPRCGEKMVLRTNKRSSEKFLGCMRYPQCSGTRPLS